MFKKFALLVSAFTCLSIPALAQESLVPRTMPPDDGKPAKVRPTGSAAQNPLAVTTAGAAPASTSVTPTPVTPAAAPVAATAGVTTTGVTPNSAASATVPATQTSPASAAPVAVPGVQTPAAETTTKSVTVTPDAAVPGAPVPPTAEQLNQTKMNQIFDEMDLNHDSIVNEAEFSIYYKTRGDDPAFMRYDRNTDGQITRIEFTEGNTIGQKTVVPPTN